MSGIAGKCNTQPIIRDGRRFTDEEISFGCSRDRFAGSECSICPGRGSGCAAGAYCRISPGCSWPTLRMDGWLSPLGRSSIRVGVRALGYAASPWRCLGPRTLGRAPRWMGMDRGTLALGLRLPAIREVKRRGYARRFFSLADSYFQFRSYFSGSVRGPALR